MPATLMQRIRQRWKGDLFPIPDEVLYHLFRCPVPEDGIAHVNEGLEHGRIVGIGSVQVLG